MAQKKTTIKLVEADKMIGSQSVGEDLNIFTGNVIFEHDSVLLYCDSAVLRSKSNQLNAFKNVHIHVNDTLNLYGDKLDYNGNTRVANITDNVKLVDNKAILTTSWLIYNRNTEIAYYTTHGKIVSDTNELTSRMGYYHTQTKMLYFNKDVVLINPSYRLESDTLVYDTFSDIAYISGPTTIVGDEEFIYAEDGWYETKTGKSRLMINPYVKRKEQFLSGDTIYYDKENSAGTVHGNAFLKDTAQNVIIQGNYVNYRRNDGYAWATQKPWATFVDKSDSLFLHADTLYMAFDSTNKASDLFAYHQCKFYRTDLQGMCDSLNYKFADSTITMFFNPVVWTQENQITAELIKLFSSNRAIDSMWMLNSAFIISSDKFKPNDYNQIKGKNMTAYFDANELHKIIVVGNAETIYFVREENGGLIGINKAFASNMEIRVADRQVTDIYYFDQPDATLYPENEIPPNEIKLRDFKWRINDRPRQKEDIFIWSEESPALRQDGF
ncbi:MAG: organic solvent tolerance protein OstA [Bacteroidales bacterium]|nr:organic solvent tolerance protein OstA [Bacteroidales bacterium]